MRARGARATTVQAAAGPATRGVLDTEPATRVRSIDEFIERVLAQTSFERASEEALQNPFVVTGLSQEESNPEWLGLQAERAALEERRAMLARNSGAMRNLKRNPEPDLVLRDALLERSSNNYEPIDAVKLLKPAAIVSWINTHWRTLLGGVLQKINADFSAETKRLMTQRPRVVERSRELRLASENLIAQIGDAQAVVQEATNTRRGAVTADALAKSALAKLAPNAPADERRDAETRAFSAAEALQQATTELDAAKRTVDNLIAAGTQAEREATELERNVAVLEKMSITDEAQAEVFDRHVHSYVQYAVNPTLNEALRQLQSATYEDLPLSRELLGELFFEFLDRLLSTLLEQPDDDDGAQRAQADEAAQVPVEMISARVEALLAHTLGQMASVDYEQVADPALREMYERSYYLRQVVHIYADNNYWFYFEQWRADALGRAEEYFASALPDGTARMAPDARARLLVASLERVVANIIDARRQSLQRNPSALAAAYEVPTDETMVFLYRQFVLKKIALHRARTLLAQNEGGELERAFAAAFEAPDQPAVEVSDSLGMQLLVRPRLDRFGLLDRAYQMRLAAINERYAGNDAALAVQTTTLNARLAALKKLLREWSPLDLPAIQEHGADDEEHSYPETQLADPFWSPFNLAYPLSLDLVNLQMPELAGFVAWHAEIFDADALHERANSLRSVLTIGFADQLLQRELQRIDFALRELARPTRPVPLDVALPLDSSAALELSAQVRLRPELEFVMGAPLGTKRDPKVLEIADSLAAIELAAVWWFQPTLDTLTGRATGGRDAYVLARQQLVVDGSRVRQATLRVESAGAARAGLYWVEFVSGDEYYQGLRSAFTARVRVTARCARDNVIYELGTEHFGQCTWSEHARSRALTLKAQEWRTMVERGPMAHKRLLEQRRFDAVVDENTGSSDAVAQMYAPPWGREDEASLLVALPVLLDSAEEFGYEAALERILRRIGAQMRALPGATAATALAAGRSNLDLLLLLADTETDESDGEFFVLQTLFAQHSASGAFIDPAARQSDSQPPAAVPAFDEESAAARLVDARARRATLPALQRREAAPPLSSSLPRNVVAVPRFESEQPLSAGAAAAHLPLATVLTLLMSPLVWPNLTWRERRFFEHVRARFDRFAATLTRRWSAELLAAACTGDQPWWKARDPVAGEAAMQAEIWRRLAALTPDSLHMDARDEDRVGEILVDRALRHEFDALVESRLIRPGLVSVYEHTVRDRLSGYLQTHRTLAPASSGDLASLFQRNGSVAALRQEWLDVHSHETNQPSVYQIAIERGRHAAVVQRGSEPCGKYYDFTGLHNIITNLVVRYNALAASDDNDAEKDLAYIETVLGDLELLYNYLAFVAGIPSNRRVVSGAQLLALVTTDSAQNIFAQARRQRAALGATLAHNALPLQVQT